MSVTETLDALGTWNVTLSPDTPKQVLDRIKYFGHIVVDVGDPDPAFMDDGILPNARFVGQLRSIDVSDTQKVLSGQGLLAWAGDSDNKGEIFETPLTLTAATFEQAIVATMPSSLHVGTIFNTVAGTISTTFVYQSKREALDFITSTMGAEWRINGDGTVDAGLQSDLYRVVPVCAIVKGAVGADLHMRALPGQFDTSSDVEDFTTRVVLLGQGENTETIVTGTADIPPERNPYKDIHGNPVKLVRMVSESGTETGAAATRAQLALSQFESTRDALTLSTEEYDIKGEVRVGDNIYVYDEDLGLFDTQNEVVFQGERMNPLTLRCTELTWPLIQGMQILYRDGDGNWTDLTRYVEWETGQTNVTVGGFDRTLTSSGETINNRPPIADTSTPGKVVLTPPFTQAAYQSPVTGATRAVTQVTWNEPLNTDGSIILDGDHYEIQYRQGTKPIFPSTWSQLVDRTYGGIKGTGAAWEQPIVYPQGPWQAIVVGWDQLSILIEELMPTHPYDVRVRAVDSANPPHFGEWSDITTFQTSDDTIAPPTPAAPVCDASLIAVQVTHFLGQASGGTFNMSPDLHHLEVHAHFVSTFEPDDSSLLGKMPVNYGMIKGQIPVVATFQISGTEQMFFKVVAVDAAGNKSTPSPGVAATPDLIDSEHISDLTASKITAGTISVDILLAGSIKTAATGARTEIDINGIRGYSPTGSPTFNQDNQTGQVSLTAGAEGSQHIDIIPDDGVGIPRIDMYEDNQTTHTTLTAFTSNFLMQRENNGTRDRRGGFAEFSEDSTFFGHIDAATGWNSWLNFSGGTAQNLTFRGRWDENTGSWGGETGKFVQNTEVAAGFGALAVSYGSTMVGGMNLNGNVLDTAGLNPNSITVSTTTSFTVAWTSARHLFVFAQGWRVV